MSTAFFRAVRTPHGKECAYLHASSAHISDEFPAFLRRFVPQSALFEALKSLQQASGEMLFPCLCFVLKRLAFLSRGAPEIVRSAARPNLRQPFLARLRLFFTMLPHLADEGTDDAFRELRTGRNAFSLKKERFRSARRADQACLKSALARKRLYLYEPFLRNNTT